MKLRRRVILYIAVSLDGYIAKPDDDLSFLDMVKKEGEDYGYADFIREIDTVIMGRKTYDWVMKHVEEYIHPEIRTFVMTRTPRPAHENLSFHTGDLELLVRKLRSEEGKGIFIDGGAEIVNQLLRLKLIDDLIISFIPVLLGTGIKLFREDIPTQELALVKSTSYESGLVQIHYRFKDHPHE